MYRQPLRPNIVWVSTPQGIIKINIDGSFSFNRNCSGIWDTFWDNEGTILLHFEKHITTDLAILTEVLAIRKKRILITTASHWTTLSTFALELDLLNAIK